MTTSLEIVNYMTTQSRDHQLHQACVKNAAENSQQPSRALKGQDDDFHFYQICAYCMLAYARAHIHGTRRIQHTLYTQNSPGVFVFNLVDVPLVAKIWLDLLISTCATVPFALDLMPGTFCLAWGTCSRMCPTAFDASRGCCGTSP